MLNWVALYTGLYLFGQGGPLQNTDQVFSPTSNEVLEAARLPVFWGDPILQGLHIGLFIALGALVAFWVIINRTTLGYEVRAVGFNPEAARYGGISRGAELLPRDGDRRRVRRARRRDRHARLAFHDRRSATSRPRPSASSGSPSRCSDATQPSEWGSSALVFGALLNGTASRNIPPEAFDIPEQAGNLSLTIQALVLLFIGADIVILYLWAKTGQRIGRR